MNKIYGVGYLGTEKNVRNNIKCYYVWRGMLRRCYDKQVWEKEPTYKICAKCRENLRNKLINMQRGANWIHVSKRLPEEHICNDGYVEPSEDVLVFTDHNQYAVSRYWGNRLSKKDDNPNKNDDWIDIILIGSKVVAWMPLPEPYEPQESEDKE